MKPFELQQQQTFWGEIPAAHVTCHIPVEDGRLPIGFSIEVRDPAGELIHLESWSRGSFHSDLHCLFTMALTIHRALRGPQTRH